MRLPELATPEAFDAWVRDDTQVSPVLDHLAASLGTGPLQRPTRGSAVVGVGERDVIKLMCPLDRALHQAEAVALRALEGVLPIPTPRVVDQGELDGWPWLRLTRLRGDELAERWPDLDPGDHLDLATQLGEALGALHAVEAPTPVPRVDWPSWVAQQRAGLVERQRARGCPEALLAQLDPFLDDADLHEGPTGWLHTEIMREHLLVDWQGGRWVLSGLFDFEPSWVAPRDYELASVGIFVSATDPVLFRAVQTGAGLDADPRRVMAMALLHRYANLAWYHRRLGGPLHLSQLAERWFGQL